MTTAHAFGFDRIAVINLPARADRRREIASELAKLGLSLAADPVRLVAAIRPDEPGPFPSLGARGCFLSHLEVLRQAMADGIHRLLILEDDCDFSQGAAPAFDRLPMHWVMLYGGWRGGVPAGEAGAWTYVPPATGLGTTHCVGLTSSAMAIAVPYLQAMLSRPPGSAQGGPMDVDGAYSWLRRDHPEITTLAATPAIAHQRSSRSDIHPARWYDRNPVCRPLVQLLRTLKRP